MSPGEQKWLAIMVLGVLAMVVLAKVFKVEVRIDPAPRSHPMFWVAVK
jgi:hypothetical protein